MSALPVVEMWGKEWYLDKRLHQLRNVENPHDFQDISPELEETVLDLFQVKSHG